MATFGQPGWNGGGAVCSSYAPHPWAGPQACNCGMPALWHKEFDTEPKWERELRESYYNTRYDTLTEEEQGGRKCDVLWDTFQHAVAREKVRRSRRSIRPKG
jgi:hypothetical protein